MADSSNPRLDARIEAAAKALKHHDSGARGARVIEFGWYESMAEDALAASDSVERPAVERLVAALRELLEVWRDPQVKANRAHLAEMNADEVLAEFASQLTTEDE